jgi:hypothetical protein
LKKRREMGRLGEIGFRCVWLRGFWCDRQCFLIESEIIVNVHWDQINVDLRRAAPGLWARGINAVREEDSAGDSRW